MSRKAANINLKSPKSFLFKSPFGFGKTLAACSFAVAGPTYLAYWDKKDPVEVLTFFRKLGERGKRVIDNLEYDVYGSDNAGEYLEKVIALKSDCRYTTFITDSITMMTSGTVGWSMGFNDKGKKIENKLIKGPDDILPDWDEYKSETALVSQALDICRTLPCHIIWTAHPVPGTKIESAGSSIKVTKVNSIVTYGSKVAGIVPGQFTEVYQFFQETTYDSGGAKKKYKLYTDAIGDDFAKTALGLPKELDFTDRLFYDVWCEALDKIEEEFSGKKLEVKNEVAKSGGQVFDASVLNLTNKQPEQSRRWNPAKGQYEP